MDSNVHWGVAQIKEIDNSAKKSRVNDKKWAEVCLRLLKQEVLWGCNSIGEVQNFRKQYTVPSIS